MYEPVVGIDPSTKKLAIAITTSMLQPQPDLHVIPIPEDLTLTEACGHVAHELGKILYQYSRDTVTPSIYLEAPAQGMAGVKVTVMHAFIDGAIMSAAYEYRCPVE